MTLQAKSPTERSPVSRDTAPVSPPASAVTDHRPGVARLHGLSETMHDSARIAAQRALAKAMHDSPRQAVQRRLADGMSARVAQLQEQLEDEEPLQGRFEAQPVSRPIQRMKVGPDTMTPEEVFESIKNSREGKKFIEERGAEALLEWLRARDSSTFSRSQLLGAVKKAATETATSDSKESEVRRGFEFMGSSVADVLLDGRKAEEVYYKIGLCLQLKGSNAYLDPFRERLGVLANALSMGAPIERAGILRTFELLTTPWGKPPSYYLTGEGFDSLTGGEKGGGIPLAFQGMNSELDAVLNVSPDELAEGEVVFNASTYADPEVEEMTKDVDVSYIDRGGVLHLIESGKDMNTLFNKVVGKRDQKAIYEHLTRRASTIEHTPAGPLTEQQAARDAITNVAWWYNVPPETLSLDTSNEDIRKSVAAMVKAGAGLRSGMQRWTPEQLAKLL